MGKSPYCLQTIIFSSPIVLCLALYRLLMNDLIMWIKQNWSIIIPFMHVWGAARESLCRLVILIQVPFIWLCTLPFALKHLWLKARRKKGGERQWHATCVWIINYIFTFTSSFMSARNVDLHVMTRLYFDSINRPKRRYNEPGEEHYDVNLNNIELVNCRGA